MPAVQATEGERVMEHRGGKGCPGALGVLMRSRREGAGLTQRQLAVRAGVSVGAVQDIEQGRTASPRPGSLARLAAALELGGREVEDLVSLSEGRRAVVGGERLPGRQGTAGSGLRLAVLGPLAAWRDGAWLPLGPVRQRAVLGLLALHPGTGLSRAAIVDALWGQDPPAAAVGVLQGYIARLRQLVGPGSRTWEGVPQPRGGGAVCWDGTGYRLAPGGIHLDLADFGELAGRARQAAGAGDARQAGRLYGQALGLWRGEPLADLDVLRGHPAVIELERRRVAVVIEYADAAGAAGMHAQALGQLRALAEREPLDERVQARLMAALAATGQQAAALGVYEDLRLRLDRELGVRPDREVAEAHIRVLRQQTRLAAAAAPGPAVARTAARPDRVVPRQLPALGAHFAGRAAELAMLDGLLAQAAGAPGTVVISAIGGTAGVGKTALAVRWAHQVAGRFPDGQLYVNLHGSGPGREPVPAGEAIRGFLDALQVPAAQIPAGLETQAGLYRSLLARRRMLVVLDNARDADQVRPLLPASTGCLVVVTSRSQPASLTAAEGAHPVTLDVLTRADARALLARRLGAERLGAGPAADELIELCARLPLALSVVAARAAEHPGFPLGAIVAELREERHRLDALDSGDPAAGVRAVFSWSYENLSDLAARLFRLLGAHPGPDLTIPAAASLVGIPFAEARRAVGELARSSLVTEHAPGRFACHDLLRVYAAEQARACDSDADRRAALRRVLDHYLHACSALSGLLEPDREQISLLPAGPGVMTESVTGHAQALAWLDAEHQVLLAAIGRAARAGFDAHAWQIPWALEGVLYRRVRWHDLQATQRTALEAAARLGDVAGQAHALRGLGRVCAWLGSFDEAQACLSQALALFQELGDGPALARAHGHMAQALGRQGRYRGALSHAEQARDLFRTSGHQTGPACALNNIGWYHIQLGDYQQALACSQQALRAFREFGDRRCEANALDTLGCAHHHLGNHARALACYQQALEAAREAGDRQTQAESLTHLGDTLHAAGDDQAARDAWTQALNIHEEEDPAEAGQLRARLASLG